MQKESHRLGLPDDYDYELIDAEFRMSREYNPTYSIDEVEFRKAEERMLHSARERPEIFLLV